MEIVQSKTEKIRQLIIIAATVGVIVVNYLAGTGRIGGVTPEFIADKYPTLITPAGYAFAIWGLIYFGMILFSVYQALPSQTANPNFKKIRSLYIFSCVANCAWLFLWHHDQIIFALLVIFALLASLALININLRRANAPGETWFARVPFSIYFGWVTVASILNATIALVSLGVTLPLSAAVISACGLIAVALILGVFISRKLSLAGYALAVAWALAAIFVARKDYLSIRIFCAAAVVLLVISAAVTFFQTGKNNNE